MCDNKIKTVVVIAGILAAVAAISSIDDDLDRKAEGQTMPSPTATNTNTQVQVGGGNATLSILWLQSTDS